MKNKKFFLFFLCSQLLVELSAQQNTSLYLPSEIKAAYNKGTRSADGSPGKKYWQNSADYDLDIKFDPSTRLLEGSELVTYHNNSPDTLHEMVMRLYPDFYKKGGLRDISIAWEDESDGVVIDKMLINDSVVDTSAKARKIIRNYTNLTVSRCRILPKQAAKLEIKWHYILNKGSHSRTGQVDEGAFFIAYCFPRVAVYDDTEGWDNSVFMGNNEPYFDFGNFTANVTVPGDYVVWGTGNLQNAEEVFSPQVLQKYKSAFNSDKPVFVIDSDNLKNKTVTAGKQWNTFRFKASYVPDFTFALSNHYAWQAVSVVVDRTTKRRAMVNTAFNLQHKDFYDVNFFSGKTIEVMSYDFPGLPYPYPHITVFDGLDQMEYPMMVNDNPLDDHAESIELTDHEIFHMLFPFYMGINQTKYAWMDEGWATVGEWYISPKIDTTITDRYGMDRVAKSTGKDFDLPLIIPGTETKLSYYINAYPKPGLVYLYLNDMLGDELFRKSVQYYMKTWNGRHPLPWDFFNCINKASEQNLDWFWKNWFYDWGAIDLSIKNVEALNPPGWTRTGMVKGETVITNMPDNPIYKVTVENKGGKAVPVYLHVTFADGSKKEYHQTAMVWKNGQKQIVITIAEKKAIKSIALEDTYVPDGDTKDNYYGK